MHELQIADMCICAACRDKMCAIMPFAQIFDDCARFGNGFAVIFNQRRLAQRVHVQKRFGRKIGHSITRMMADFIRKVQFFEQPQDTLRTRIVEMVYDDGHGCFLMDGRNFDAFARRFRAPAWRPRWR